MAQEEYEYRPLISPEEALVIFSAINDDSETASVDMCDLLARVYEEAYQRPFVTAPGLSYILDPDDTDQPTPAQIRRVLEALVWQRKLVKTGSGVLAQYAIVHGSINERREERKWIK